MGYNTVLMVLNDSMDQLRKNPEEFTEKLLDHSYDGGTYGVGNHANPVQVSRSRHADEFQLHGTHGNLMIELNPYSSDTEGIINSNPHIVRRYIRQARSYLDALEKKLDSEQGIPLDSK